MPIKIVDLDEGRGNQIVGSGTLTGEEYVGSLKGHLTQSKDKFKKYRYSLPDYTAVTKVEVPSKDIELVARLCMEAAVVNPDVVVAIITDQDITYGLSRMWEILVSDTNWEVMVFRSRYDADAWIRKRVNEKFGINDLTMA